MKQILLLLSLLLLPAVPRTASPDTISCPVPETAVSVRAQRVEDESWLFLPAWTDLHALVLEFPGKAVRCAGPDGEEIILSSGRPFDLTKLFPDAPEDGVYPLTFRQGGETFTLSLMRSENLPALYLSSADPRKDRAFVEEEKGSKAEGSALLLDPEGTVLYQGGVKQIKGRGNSTWNYPKKPYQIKLEEEADLMACDEPAETWVLLANYCDDTLLHNRVTYDLALSMGMTESPHCRPVDLYYDGEYRGSYLLSEKTEVGPSRLDIRDLEPEIETANPGVKDLDDLPLRAARTPAGYPAQYVGRLTAPEDLSGGYLLEVDFPSRAKREKSWFSTAAGKYLVVKSPESLPREGLEYISQKWQEFEDALLAGDETCGQFLDLHSLARVYLLEELSQDPDAFQSSCYFYTDAGEDIFHAGPIWDFDSGYGSDGQADPTGFTAAYTVLGRLLLASPAFREEVRLCWEEEVYPLVRGTVYPTQGPGFGTIAEDGMELLASQRMDRKLWPKAAAEDYAAAVGEFRQRMLHRVQWLDQTFTSWGEDPVLPAAFSDVEANSWYATPVAEIARKGILSGTSESCFSPKKPLTRAMAVTALYRMAGSPKVRGESGFADVPADAWYAPAVTWAKEAGIAQGFHQGETFRPKGTVRREELLTFLYRYAGLEGEVPKAGSIPETFADRAELSPWAEEAMAWGIEQGLVRGTRDDTLSPRAKTLRAQGAVLFQRFGEILAPEP